MAAWYCASDSMRVAQAAVFSEMTPELCNLFAGKIRFVTLVDIMQKSRRGRS